MNTVEITKRLVNSNLKLLTLADLKKLLSIKVDNTAYKTAERLSKKGILKRLRKGIYAFTLSPPSDFEKANSLYTPSYLSLESALSFYGIIPQFVYTITSVTPRKTNHLIVQGKEFAYVHINPACYFGYSRKENLLIATAEKALIDELYFISKGLRKLSLEELDLSEIDKKTFHYLAAKITFKPFQKLRRRLGL